jgi:hypothetical protein
MLLNPLSWADVQFQWERVGSFYMTTYNFSTTLLRLGTGLGILLLAGAMTACGGGSSSAPTASTAAVQVLVQSADGGLLPGASVQVGTQVVTSNAGGVATLAGLPMGQDIVLQASLAGYVPQAIRTQISSSAEQRQVTLLPTLDSQKIPDIAAAQIVKSSVLNASVTLPSAAFVKPDGTPATGAATADITPWDISGSDAIAMLGGGVAKNASGAIVDLISAGMMTVDFYSASGEHLQLAPGKTAVIQMDLPFANVNGQTLGVGSTIPLWHFDPSQGMWIEEGTGVVVASTTSSTQLAVKATVSHFSTYNWDMQFVGGATAFAKCLLAGIPVECTGSVVATLPGGSVRSHGVYIATAGTQMVNMPTAASVVWTLRNTDAVTGVLTELVTTTPIQSSYTFNLQPLASHRIDCKPTTGVSANVAVGCDATLTLAKSAGAPTTKSVHIPATGLVLTYPADVVSIAYSAVSDRRFESPADVVKYSGSLAATPVGSNVTIPLPTRAIDLTVSNLSVKCEPLATDGTPLSTCNLEAGWYSGVTPLVAPTYVSVINQTIPTGVNVPVVFVPGSNWNSNWKASATSGSYTGSAQTTPFQQGAAITITLHP